MTILLPAMKEVGDQFGSGELILPFVLQSAEIMRSATNFLEKYLDKDQHASRGKIVLATVFGDVHDIGKNLVATILSNNGFEVIDLGKQVPAEMIVQKGIGRESHCDRTERPAGQHQPANAHYSGQAPRIGTSDTCPDRWGSHQCRILPDRLHPKTVGNIPFIIARMHLRRSITEWTIPFESKKPDTKLSSSQEIISVNPSGASKIPSADNIPAPPFTGYKVLQISFRTLFEQFNLNALFRMSWGARNAQGEKWEKLSGQFNQILDKLRDGIVIRLHGCRQPRYMVIGHATLKAMT